MGSSGGRFWGGGPATAQHPTPPTSPPSPSPPVSNTILFLPLPLRATQGVLWCALWRVHAAQDGVVAAIKVVSCRTINTCTPPPCHPAAPPLRVPQPTRRVCCGVRCGVFTRAALVSLLPSRLSTTCSCSCSPTSWSCCCTTSARSHATGGRVCVCWATHVVKHGRQRVC